MQTTIKTLLFHNKKLIKDFLFTSISSFLPVLILQFFLYPSTSQIIGSEEYGKYLSIISIITIISISLGNSLNNVRLIYQKNCHKDDFNILLFGAMVLNTLFVIPVVLIFIKNVTIEAMVFIVVTSMFSLLRSYAQVVFRIKLDFSKFLISQTILTLGYITGYFIFTKTQNYLWIYVVGEVASFVYCLYYSDIIGFSFHRSKSLKKITTDYVNLMNANIIISCFPYLDRLILYPLVGGEAVSIYFAASIFAKIGAMVITPINNLMLSYLTKMDKFSKKFDVMLLVSIVIGIVISLLLLIVGKYLIILLYPSLADEAIKILPLTILGNYFSIMCSVINPILLKFKEMVFQVKTNGILLIIYVISSIVLLQNFGLFGLAFSFLFIKVVNFLIVGKAYLNVRKHSQITTNE